MKYTLEIGIDVPRDKVIELFVAPKNMRHWQESLVSVELLSGTQGQTGAKSKLIHKFGNQDTSHKFWNQVVEMIETVENRNLPDEFTCTYEAKGAWNRVVNRFVEIDSDRTKWIFETEFRCTGFLRIMSFFMPGIFKKASLKDMKEFKAFAESYTSYS